VCCFKKIKEKRSFLVKKLSVLYKAFYIVLALFYYSLLYSISIIDKMGKVYTPGTKAVNINNNVPTLEQSFKAAFNFAKEQKSIESLDSIVFILLSEDSCVLHRWKMLARTLKMAENIINEIVYEEKTDLKEQCYQMLLRWKNSNGFKATAATLINALRESQLNEAADILARYI